MVRSPHHPALFVLGFAISLAACSSPTGTTSGVVEVGVAKSTDDRPIVLPLDEGGSGSSGVAVTAGGKVDALAVANRLVVANEYPSGYERDYFRHWVTVDAAGCNAREHVLKQESITLPQVDSPCYVVAGDWYSAYDGITLSDRAEVGDLGPLVGHQVKRGDGVVFLQRDIHGIAEDRAAFGLHVLEQISWG